ncbi:MAG: translation initiation factor IF-3 [Myxococcota bacterium]
MSRPKNKHRVNKDIKYHELRVIDPEGNQLGLMTPDEGRDKARDFGMDLVEVAPKARPPVCRIMDYGKFKYEQSKKESNNQQDTPEIKTVQMRPKTDDHDLNTKLKRAQRFLKRGDKVKLVMRMRGRERAYANRWIDLLNEHFDEMLAEHGEIASKPDRQGRVITMLVEPTTS